LKALSEDHLKDVGTGGAKGDADAEFVGLAGDAVGHHAVDTDGDKNQADQRKDDHQLEAEARLRKCKKIEKVLERVGLCHGYARVGGPDFTADGIDHGSGIAGSSDEDAAHSGSREGVGDPSFGIDRIFEAKILSIGRQPQ